MPRRNDISKVLVIVLLMTSTGLPCTIEIVKPVRVKHACGIVLSDAGAPLSGLHLFLRKAHDSEWIRPETVTDAEGKFDFGPVAEGEYWLNAESKTRGMDSGIVVRGGEKECRRPMYVVSRERRNCNDSRISMKKPTFD